MKKVQFVEKLNVADSNISDWEITMLAISEFLKVNGVQQELNISGNQLKNGVITALK